jgi:hypothetical protein
LRPRLSRTARFFRAVFLRFAFRQKTESTGEPAWSTAGNFLTTELPYALKLVTGIKDAYLLVDSRPAVKYN